MIPFSILPDMYEDAEVETSAPLTTCLQPIDTAQHIADRYEDEILCLAPAEGNLPQSILDKEAEAFPTLFPDGNNTFKEEREAKLSLTQYIKSRLMSTNSKFAENTEYIFYLQYLKEFQEVMSSARINLRKGSNNSANFTANDLIAPGAVKNILRKNTGYKFLTKVRGSAPYWEGTMRDLCAMVRQLGTPTWFCSFSAADRRWMEIAEAILKLQGKEMQNEMTWTEHCQVINSNPVVAAMMFNKRARHLLKDLILSEAQPIGEVVDFFYRIEFQQRGWPHIHALYWVKDAPKLTANNANDKDVCDFVNQHVTCEIPEKKLITG